MLRPMLIAAVLLAATAPTACRDTATQPGGAATGLVTSRAADHGRPSPSVTLRWNGITRDYVTSLTAKPSQQAVLRDFAYLSLAQYEALTTARHSKHEEGGAARVQGAIVGASLAVLQSLLPAGATQFANEAAADRSAAAAVGEQDAFDAGVTLGRSIGTDVIASASTDRFNAVWTGTVPVGPGLWFSSANPAAPPLLPLLGQMRPFFMASGDQFRPPPPPTFRSPEYLAFLAEVRHFSDTRTPEQLAIAKFWAQTTGSLTAGFWNEEAARVAQQHHLSERRVARTLALANMAAMDAIIACHDAKYTYWLIRPPQADPAITTPVGLPNHPSYAANHACLSGAFAYVLGTLIPQESDRLAAMADEAGESRLYAGIHYRFDKDAGLRIGRQVSDLALSTGLPKVGKDETDPGEDSR